MTNRTAERPGKSLTAAAKPFLSLRRLALALPIVFLLHVIEETPGFVEWFNSLVARGISQSLFLTVNLVAFLITVSLAAMVAAAPGPGTGVVLSAWVGFLMLANGLFHLVGTLVHGRYSPGVVTGTLLYLPVGILALRAVAHETGIKPAAAILAACAGAIPMLAHGYLIVFRGSRLF